MGDGLVLARGLEDTLRGAGVEGGAVANAVRVALEPLEEQVRGEGGERTPLGVDVI